jgi:hypothetical protein
VSVQWNDNGTTRRGEAQLRVHGNIRSDVVFQPGAIKFDAVDQGSSSEQQVRVTYAGRSDWKIIDVRGASDDLEVELTETQRFSGRVAYDLLVRMKDTARAGYFNEQLVLVTSDSSNPRIPLHVEGRIVPQISVAPEALRFGEVAHGNAVPMKILVRGKKPFRITAMECDADCFEFKTDDKASARHIVEVVFAANQEPGTVKETIHIATDLGDSFETTLTAYATIVAAAAEVPATESSDMTSADDQGAVTDSGSAEQVAAQ